MGLVEKGVYKTKVEVELLLGKEVRYPDNKIDGKWVYPTCQPILNVNGIEHVLNESTTKLFHLADLTGKIWGKTYSYCGSSKKKLNRVKNAKRVLEDFKTICEKGGESQDLIEALDAAIAQAK